MGLNLTKRVEKIRETALALEKAEDGLLAAKTLVRERRAEAERLRTLLIERTRADPRQTDLFETDELPEERASKEALAAAREAAGEFDDEDDED